MDENPLQRRVYFLTFVESLEMIFSWYTETCEVLLDYPKIGGEDIKEYLIHWWIFLYAQISYNWLVQ